MVMPLREALGLNGHQPMSPAMEERLCHLAISVTSYERAAEVARRFGVNTDDSQLGSVTQESCNSLCDNGYDESEERRTQKWQKDVKNSNEFDDLSLNIMDSKLNSIIAIWPRLPEEIRIAVTAIVTPYAKEEAASLELLKS
jgi:hypothetical protein